FKAINKYAPSGGARLGGVIANSILAPYATSLIDDFASRTGTRVVGYVPRSIEVSQSELYGQTVIEASPASTQAQVYRNLATFILGNGESRIPNPLNGPDLKDWARGWGDRIFKSEAGIVEASGGI
ncbi:MAG TPA: hypothetical protein VIU29_00350, partial [Candidatus Deferrimicrobiaceae bacterium]